MTDRLTEGLRTQLQANLDAFTPEPLDGETLRAAAVCIAVTATEAGAPAIFLTLRPSRMGRHAGQYALPGGKIDAGETAEQAARREMAEEIGVSLSEDALMGRLDDYATRSGFVITPFVFWAGNARDVAPSPDEVEVLFRIPFSELDSDAIPYFQEGETEDRPILYSRFPTLGHSMFSPTAAMIYQFREVAIRGQATRVAHYDQPRFAWK